MAPRCVRGRGGGARRRSAAVKSSDAPAALLNAVLFDDNLLCAILSHLGSAAELVNALCVCAAWEREGRRSEEELWAPLATSKFSEAAAARGWLSDKPWKTRYRVLLKNGRALQPRTTLAATQAGLKQYEFAVEVRTASNVLGTSTSQSVATDEPAYDTVLGSAEASRYLRKGYRTEYNLSHFAIESSFDDNATVEGGISVRYADGEPLSTGAVIEDTETFQNFDACGKLLITVYVRRIRDGKISLLLEFEVDLAERADEDDYGASGVFEVFSDGRDDFFCYEDEEETGLSFVKQVIMRGRHAPAYGMPQTTCSEEEIIRRTPIELGNDIFLPHESQNKCFGHEGLAGWEVEYEFQLLRPRTGDDIWQLCWIRVDLGYAMFPSGFFEEEVERRQQFVMDFCAEHAYGERKDLSCAQLLALLESKQLDWAG